MSENKGNSLRELRYTLWALEASIDRLRRSIARSIRELGNVDERLDVVFDELTRIEEKEEEVDG